jgi:dipeptidyl aminopeptidase/acylaminoacyl peptidase
VTQGYDELYDAQAALEFLFNRSEIDPQQIGAAGFSMGGATALRAAARQPEIRAVVRDGGFSNLGRLLSPEDTQSFPAYFQKATILMLYRLRSGIDPAEVDCISDLAAINPRPVLLIYGEHEAAAGWEQSEASGKNVDLWIVPNGAHGSNHLVAPDEYVQRVLNFFDQALLK